MNEIKIVIEGMKELTEAVNALSGRLWQHAMPGTAQPGQGMPPAVNTAPPAPLAPAAPAFAPAMPGQLQPYPGYQMPPQAPAGMPAVPVGMPGRQPAAPAPAVPTNAVPQQFTQEQLAIAATGLVDQGRQQALMGILAKYGAQALTQVPRERYGELAVDLRGAGAAI